jgi:hypothetical protein
MVSYVGTEVKMKIETWQAILVMVVGVLNVVALIFNAFFKSYAEKKGENLATKEDVKYIIAQVKQVTSTTEEIKSQFSKRDWSEQRTWEMKRDTAIDIMKTYGTLLQTSIALFEAAVRDEVAFRKRDEEEKKLTSAEYDAAYKEYSAAIAFFWQVEEIAKLIFSSDVAKAMKTVKDSFTALAVKIVDNATAAASTESLFTDVYMNQTALSEAIRTELKLVVSP